MRAYKCDELVFDAMALTLAQMLWWKTEMEAMSEALSENTAQHLQSTPLDSAQLWQSENFRIIQGSMILPACSLYKKFLVCVFITRASLLHQPPRTECCLYALHNFTMLQNRLPFSSFGWFSTCAVLCWMNLCAKAMYISLQQTYFYSMYTNSPTIYHHSLQTAYLLEKPFNIYHWNGFGQTERKKQKTKCSPVYCKQASRERHCDTKAHIHAGHSERVLLRGQLQHAWSCYRVEHHQDLDFTAGI